MEKPIDTERRERLKRLHRILSPGKISHADIMNERAAIRRDQLWQLVRRIR